MLDWYSLEFNLRCNQAGLWRPRLIKADFGPCVCVHIFVYIWHAQAAMVRRCGSRLRAAVHLPTEVADRRLRAQVCYVGGDSYVYGSGRYP